jgi:sulfatase modifying factor 1
MRRQRTIVSLYLLGVAVVAAGPGCGGSVLLGVENSSSSSTGASGSASGGGALAGGSGASGIGGVSIGSASSSVPPTADATTAKVTATGDASSEDSAACSPSATQCSGGGVETCDSDGRWGSPWPCATGECTNNACAGSTNTGASCAQSGPGLTLCSFGGTGTGPSESCCTSPEVPGGGPTVLAGFSWYSSTTTLTGYRLDKYLVTAGRFHVYVDYLANGGAPPADGSGKHTHVNGGQGLIDIGNSDGGVSYESGWDAADWNAEIATGPGAADTWSTNLTSCGADNSTWTDAPTTATESYLPINCVNWYEAYAFCIWDGGFLPTQSEWRYAAAGGSQQREAPWTTGFLSGAPLGNATARTTPSGTVTTATASLGHPQRIAQARPRCRSSRPLDWPHSERGAGGSSIWWGKSWSGRWTGRYP